jgi:hypothetical protein
VKVKAVERLAVAEGKEEPKKTTQKRHGPLLIIHSLDVLELLLKCEEQRIKTIFVSKRGLSHENQNVVVRREGRCVSARTEISLST